MPRTYVRMKTRMESKKTSSFLAKVKVGNGQEKAQSETLEIPTPKAKVEKKLYLQLDFIGLASFSSQRLIYLAPFELLQSLYRLSC